MPSSSLVVQHWLAVCYHGSKSHLKIMHLAISSSQQKHAQQSTREMTSCLMHINRQARRLKWDQSDNVESDTVSQAKAKFSQTGRTSYEITTIKLNHSTTWLTKLHRCRHLKWSLWPKKKTLSVPISSACLRWLLVDTKKPTQGFM